MKKNIILTSLVAALAFIGCARDDSYDAPNSFSDVAWIFSDVEGVLDANVSQYITFTDASQGYTSHKWQIPEGSFYLEHPLDRNDQGDSLLRTKITGSGTSADKTISVFFTKPGLQPVRLINKFPDSVGYRGVDDYRASAELIDGEWVIDTTFFVDVYTRILPKVQIDHPGGTETWQAPENIGNNTNPTQTSEFEVITIEAGNSIDLTDITEIGRPDASEWRIISADDIELGTPFSYEDGEGIGSEATINHTFSSLGNFFIGIRSARASANIPQSSTQVVLPYIFRVVPSSQPLEILGDVIELDNEVIRVPFNGEFLPFTGQESFFTVTVNGTPFNIDSVTPNATFIEIALSDPIYRTDMIRVSYDGNGDINSTDFRQPEPFTDAPVVTYEENLLAEEVQNITAGIWTQWFNSQGTAEVSTEQSAPGTGDSSLKLTITPAQGNSIGGVTAANLDQAPVLEAGKQYIVRYQVYIDPSSAVIPNNFEFLMLDDWGYSAGSATTGLPTGEWIQIERTYARAPLTILQLYMRVRANGVPADATLYFDDFQIIDMDDRP